MIQLRSITAGRFAACLGLVAALATAGCGGSGGANSLGGNVKLGGAPLTAGTVHLLPTGGADTTPQTTIIDNGHYYFANVPAGDVKLAVEGPGKSSDASATAPTGSVPAKYASADTSGLTYTVKAGDNKHDIELSP